MFTGIIKAVGTIVKESPNLVVKTPFKKIKKGESVAVDGVCLTALKSKAQKRGTEISFEVSGETEQRTTLGRLKPGTRVNLEMPIRAGETFGGHFVQGHVDGMGKITMIKPESHSKIYTFSFPPEMKKFLAPKGSISVDGISLTLSNIDDGKFEVSVLPFTESETTLSRKSPGDLVNLEADIIAKAVAQHVSILHS